MTAARKLSPREHRAKHLKPDFARAARLARETVPEPVSQRDVAADLDVPQTIVHRWEQGDDSHAPSVLHVAGTRFHSLAEALVRWQASFHELQVLSAVRVLYGDNHAKRLATLIVECGALTTGFAAALVDGVLTDTELEALLPLSRACAQSALEFERWMTEELASRRAARA